MRNIAFIGLGIMGSPMACNLVRAGFDVVGFNRSPDKARPLADAGGRIAGSLSEAVKAADAICLMLPDSTDVQEVLTSPGGVLAEAAPGSLVIDFSTIRPDVTQQLAAAATAGGLRYLDAPVSGGEIGAIDASLAIMVGGTPEDVAAAGPLLGAVSRVAVRVGGHGAGQTVKAANQLMVAAHLQALAEAAVLLEAYGVDLGPALDVLSAGLAGSRVLEQKRVNVLEQSFQPGFRIGLHHKDLGIVGDAARQKGVVTPLAATLAQVMASAVAVGDGGLDHSALLRGVQRLSGRTPGSIAPPEGNRE